MLVDERRQHILKIIEEHGFVSVQHLMDACRASESTVRRDLEHLDGIGQIRRTRGGAAYIGESLTGFEDRSQRASREKRELAKAAAELIQPEETLLLDGGTTADGLPYLVMEYVEGEPIDTYCDRRALGVADRIWLMLQACAAVQHAHAHLVVHRDLKPGNILVTAGGEIRLLDFGIAKLLGDGTGVRIHDTTSLRPLTPSHASPEQISGGPISTATLPW